MSEVIVFGFGHEFFTVIALICSAFVSVHICFGQNVHRARESCIMLLLLLLVSTQYYHLGNVVTYLPASRFFVYNVSIHTFYCVLMIVSGADCLD
jgi:hypothetical protein